MTSPHPKDFTVDIRQLPEGGWRLQINEVPAFWGEGADLADALDALRKRALPGVPTTAGAPREETLRGAAAAFAAESAVEMYVAAQDGVGPEDMDSGPWDDVSVISRRRKAPPSSGSPR